MEEFYHVVFNFLSANLADVSAFISSFDLSDVLPKLIGRISEEVAISLAKFIYTRIKNKKKN